MQHTQDQLNDELKELKEDLEHFQKEKERVRELLGSIGGVPKFHTKLVNTIFVISIVVSLVIAAMVDQEWQILMIEITAVALSVKIMYLIHCQMRVNHFQFWVLSSIEWRVNELMKLARETNSDSEPE